MDQSTEIEVNVDEQYENEKGVFKVISIHKDQMVIRWENGQETKTDIVLQRRIAERRQWEERKRSADVKTTKKAKSKRPQTPKESVFSGLAATDFKTSAYRTTWRSRDQMGTAVVQKIETNQFQFNSWAFGSQPEMHVQDIRHRDKAAAEGQAKFFVRIDPQAVSYGFRVVRPENHGDASTGWDTFREWLTRKENEQAIQTVAVNHHLTACHRAHPSTAIRAAADDGSWHSEGPAPQTTAASLMAYVDATPEAEPFEFELFATITKDDALACGRDIAPQIARLFTDLLPLYQAAANP
jgi:hypothetical protein